MSAAAVRMRSCTDFKRESIVDTKVLLYNGTVLFGCCSGIGEVVRALHCYEKCHERRYKVCIKSCEYNRRF